MGVELTKGHLESNGGLRGHSVGDTFPFIVFAKGTFDALLWYVRTPSGNELGGWNKPHHAEQFAIELKEAL